uniref:DUF1003 domain-containing protein n=1 Tax=mine drainage metagenome TaxID=410659 RepID=E6PJ03_9ZZZZ
MTKQTHRPVDEAIESIAELERKAEDDVSGHQRWIERVTKRIGQPRMVYGIVAFVALWVGSNALLHLTHLVTPDPPPFLWLQGIVSFTALLMTVLILTTEHRLTQITVLRNRLDLQINLLTERKVAKIIAMLDEMRRDSPSIPTHYDPEVRELRERMDPQEVVEAMESPAIADPDSEQ